MPARTPTVTPSRMGDRDPPAVELARPPPRPGRTTPGRLRVLVVDDCPDTVLSLQFLLGLWGHETRAAADGPAALQAAASYRPDVVLLDIRLPGLDGYEVACRLRAHPATTRTTLVAATRYGTAADRAAARRAGFDHHLLKPFDLGDLERLLASHTAVLLLAAGYG